MTDKRAAFNIAFVTAASVFIMGYINAFSLSLARDPDTWLLGTMITAQTGNLVWMGKRLAEGNWSEMLLTIMLFSGFVVGNIYGYATKGIFKNKTKQFFFNWTNFILPLVAFPFYLHFIGTNVALFILGFTSGVALSFFRQMYHLDINNAMATGSARFFGLWLYEALFKRNKTEKKEVFTFALYAVLILVFILGASVYTWLSYLGPLANNFWSFPGNNADFYISELGLIVICIVPYFFAPYSSFTKPQGKYGGGITKEKENYGGGINAKNS